MTASTATAATATRTPARLRGLYRSLLRELPRRPLAARSSLQARLRAVIANAEDCSTTATTNNSNSNSINHETTIPIFLSQAAQYTQYARAQRRYATLLERYNPGADMDEAERVRLTARRVGMDLPVE